jgi:hypothetical protein
LIRFGSARTRDIRARAYAMAHRCIFPSHLRSRSGRLCLLSFCPTWTA